MKLNKIKLFSLLILSSFLFTACSDWLDRDPSDKVLEDEVYGSESNICEALNGLYLKMAGTHLYGTYMTQTVVEILAQRYQIEGNMQTQDPIAYRVASYSYSEPASRTAFINLWRDVYNLILDTNYFIEKVEASGDVVPEARKKLILGEAYALRAYVHLDMLRLFGPVYSEDPQGKKVPYYTKAKAVANDPLPADEFMEQVLKDIDHALTQLANDPILTLGVQVGSDYLTLDYLTDFWTYRNRRLNYFAVSVLKARALMYMGKTEEAGALASKLINEENVDNYFPWVNAAAISYVGREDYILASEVLFGIHNGAMQHVYSDKFISSLETSYVYAINNTTLIYMFEAQGGLPTVTDVRMKYLKPEASGTKYNTAKLSRSTYETDNWYFQPLIRKAELYYILAEASNDFSVLNTVREKRETHALENTEQLDFTNELTKEYMKEFIQEGQLFFYYKRKNLSTIYNNNGEMRSMSSNQYVVPVPETETSF